MWPDGTSLSENIVPINDLADAEKAQYAAALIVSDRLFSLDISRPVVTYRPPTLVVGVGCRRGVTDNHLSRLMTDTLRAHRLAVQSVAKIATADIKADEAGILALARSHSLPFETYDAAELNAVAASQPERQAVVYGLHQPTASAAQDLLGVFGVAEPAAMLASGAAGVIVPRTKSDRATIAVARIPISKGDQ